MLIFSEFNIEFTLPAPTAMIALLHLHPSLQPRLQSSDEVLVESLGVPYPPNTVVPTVDYLDVFGNICSRFSAPAGHLRLSGSNVIEADEFPDTLYPDAQQMRVDDLPSEVLQFLLPSRYCEGDQFGAIAHNEFASVRPGWERAVAIRDWVHDKITFNYNAARPTKTSTDVFHRTSWRLPRFSAPRNYAHPLHEHPSAVRDRPHRRYPSTVQRHRRLQCLVSGVSGRAMDRPRRSSQLPAPRPNTHGHGPRCCRRCHHYEFRNDQSR